MRITVLRKNQFADNLELLRAMFRLRRRVFDERLAWNVSVNGEFEIDDFDVLGPCYLLVLSDDGEVVGSVRLLPTTGPTMLGQTFPTLLDGQPAPRSELILESSRFCVDTRLAGTAAGCLNKATFMLFAAMIESLRAVGARSILTVTDLRMERILRRAEWPLERIATPRPIGSTVALAGYLHDSEQALAALYRRAGVSGSVLGSPSWQGAGI